MLNRKASPDESYLQLRVYRLSTDELEEVWKDLAGRDRKSLILKMVRRRMQSVPVAVGAAESYNESMRHLVRSRQREPSEKVLEGVGLLKGHMERLEKDPLS